jgi:hypothetical protein
MTTDILKLCDGKFLPGNISDGWCAARPQDRMDGTCVADWLRGIGETVVSNRDTGRNGEAVTASGYVVSTNGYVHRVKS